MFSVLKGSTNSSIRIIIFGYILDNIFGPSCPNGSAVKNVGPSCPDVSALKNAFVELVAIIF